MHVDYNLCTCQHAIDKQVGAHLDKHGNKHLLQLNLIHVAMHRNNFNIVTVHGHSFMVLLYKVTNQLHTIVFTTASGHVAL